MYFISKSKVVSASLTGFYRRDFVGFIIFTSLFAILMILLGGKIGENYTLTDFCF